MFDAESMIENGLGVVPRYRRVFIVNAGGKSHVKGGGGRVCPRCANARYPRKSRRKDLVFRPTALEHTYLRTLYSDIQGTVPISSKRIMNFCRSCPPSSNPSPDSSLQRTLFRRASDFELRTKLILLRLERRHSFGLRTVPQSAIVLKSP
jgi:hypothetical protein